MAEIIVSREFEGMKIQRFIKRLYPSLPISLIYRIIRKGKVRVNRKKVEHNFVVKEGDSVILHLPPDMLTLAAGDEGGSDSNYVISEEDIIFENEDFIAINKPAGLAVHGGEGHKEDVLLGAIKRYLNFNESQLRFPPTPVHRLDIDTSGVLIFAKNYDFLRGFNEIQRGQKIYKEYVALVSGRSDRREFVIELPVIRRDRPGGLSTEKVGKTIVKPVAVSEKFAGELKAFSLLRVIIRTGRTHQIRSHLMQKGLPIVGDRLYGDKEVNRWALKRLNLKRQFLHSAIMRFSLNGGEYELTAPMPYDLRDVLSNLDIDFTL